MFDKIPIGSHPMYCTLTGSIQYAFYLFSFTEVGVSNFTASADGTNTMENQLWCVFIVATFVLCLHLLNMLVAIMGDI